MPFTGRAPAGSGSIQVTNQAFSFLSQTRPGSTLPALDADLPVPGAVPAETKLKLRNHWFTRRKVPRYHKGPFEGVEPNRFLRADRARNASEVASQLAFPRKTALSPKLLCLDLLTFAADYDRIAGVYLGKTGELTDSAAMPRITSA
jgi:hypothetical protein